MHSTVRPLGWPRWGRYSRLRSTRRPPPLTSRGGFCRPTGQRPATTWRDGGMAPVFLPCGNGSLRWALRCRRWTWRARGPGCSPPTPGSAPPGACALRAPVARLRSLRGGRLLPRRQPAARGFTTPGLSPAGLAFPGAAGQWTDGGHLKPPSQGQRGTGHRAVRQAAGVGAPRRRAGGGTTSCVPRRQVEPCLERLRPLCPTWKALGHRCYGTIG